MAAFIDAQRDTYGVEPICKALRSPRRRPCTDERLRSLGARITREPGA
jgi:hypothetical protein